MRKIWIILPALALFTGCQKSTLTTSEESNEGTLSFVGGLPVSDNLPLSLKAIDTRAYRVPDEIIPNLQNMGILPKDLSRITGDTILAVIDAKTLDTLSYNTDPDAFWLQELYNFTLPGDSVIAFTLVAIAKTGDQITADLGFYDCNATSLWPVTQGFIDDIAWSAFPQDGIWFLTVFIGPWIPGSYDWAAGIDFNTGTASFPYDDVVGGSEVLPGLPLYSDDDGLTSSTRPWCFTIQ